MKLVLEAAFMATARTQYASIGGPDAANTAALGDAVSEYAMAAAFQQQLFNPFDPAFVMQVAPPHTWYGQTVGGSRIGFDNPDTIYRFTPVNATSNYVITGRFVGTAPAALSFSVVAGNSGGATSSVLSGNNLDVGADGSFVINVGRDAPAAGQRNYLQIPNDATLIAVRDTLTDWNSQTPVALSIQRVSGPPNSLFSQLGGFILPGIGPAVTGNPFLTQLVSLIPPLPSLPPFVRGLQTAYVMARGIQMEADYIKVATQDPVTGSPQPVNQLSAPVSNTGFLAVAQQSSGYFQLANDQALVVTLDPGTAKYFVLPVTNDWTISQNYWDQQSSLNVSQAVANPDGTYTFVVSPTDPGVANWVSTGGLNQGTISLRLQGLDPNSPDKPSVTTDVVSLDQLAATLPPTTVYVTEEQRAAQLAARKAGYDRRFAPYSQV